MEKLTLEFDPQSLNIVVACLKKAPWEVAHPVLINIEQQMQAHALKQQPTPPVKAVPAAKE